jgi:hypothetical protein
MQRTAGSEAAIEQSKKQEQRDISENASQNKKGLSSPMKAGSWPGGRNATPREKAKLEGGFPALLSAKERPCASAYQAYV